jgi:HK97 family phage portal protein
VGLLDRLFRSRPAVAPNGQPVYYRHYPEHADVDVLGLTVEELWRTQPYLRTVVTFLARNIAQLGLHTFERVSDDDRRRVKDDPLAVLLSRPNPRQTSYELVFSLVADLALYDEALWWVGEDGDAESGWVIQPIPPSWVTGRGGNSLFETGWYDIQSPAIKKPLRVPADQLLVFHGWNPDDLATGSTPVSALKQILAEQIHAHAYRQQVWQRGGRVGTVLVRPATAPPWGDEARKRFAADWRAKWTGDDGPKAGGTPILEDGMDLKRIGFSAHEDEFVAAAKLSLSMVASAYHVNPTMVGVLENANYSNVKEFRRMLYGDTLGPTMAMIEDRINTFLVPRVTANRSLYVEFNIEEKLQGSFEEQTQALQASVGRPWMTANEARALRNLPAIDNGDQLVTPLNVIVGGQASPQDSGSQNLRGRAGSPVKRAKARAPQTHADRAAEMLSAFFTRQGRVVRTALGAKADHDWWDGDRWDRELTDDLYRLAVMVSREVAHETMTAIGFGPDVYDEDRTLAFLRAVAERIAGQLNRTTLAQLEAALAEDESMEAVGHVFEVAETSRAEKSGLTAVTSFAGFATTEAARQAAGERATKTWNVNSGNPRSSHAALAGETVGIDETFSNGAAWPGDAVLDVDDLAGCQCSLSINIPD